MPMARVVIFFFLLSHAAETATLDFPLARANAYRVPFAMRHIGGHGFSSNRPCGAIFFCLGCVYVC